jgi:hypothetical protein
VSTHGSRAWWGRRLQHRPLLRGDASTVANIANVSLLQACLHVLDLLLHLQELHLLEIL